MVIYLLLCSFVLISPFCVTTHDECNSDIHLMQCDISVADVCTFVDIFSQKGY